MEPDMEKLRSRREVMFAKVKWELSVAETLRTRNPTSTEVQERKDKLVQLAGNFEAVQTAIEESIIHLEDVASVFTYRFQFEEVYYKIKGIYTAYLKEEQERMCNNSTGRGESSNDDLQDAVRALIKTKQAMIAHHTQPSSGGAAAGQVSNQCPALNVIQQKRSEALETYPAPTKQAKQESTKEEKSVKPNVSEEVHASDSTSSCAKCTKQHPTHNCKQFKRMDVAARRGLAQTSKLCFNCLRPHHSAKQCPSASVCHTAACYQRHHTLLCTQEDKQPETTAEQEQSSQERDLETSVNTPQTLGDKSGSTLLPTVVARVKARDIGLQEVSAFIDCGSPVSLNSEACVKRLRKRPSHATLDLTDGNAQVVGTTAGMAASVISSFNTEACAMRLGMRRSHAALELTGGNAQNVGTTARKATLVISTQFEDERKLVTQAFVLGKLTATPPFQRFNVSSKPDLKGLQQADPCFERASSVNLTLGSDVFLQDRLHAGQIYNKGIPVAQRSTCDWMAAGRISKQGCAHTYNSVVNLRQEVDIDRTLRLFWENLHSPKQLTKEEKRVVEGFNSTLTRTEKGRFVVCSTDGSKLKLGISLAAATSRLQAMERKRDNSFKQQRTLFQEEYQQPGNMQLVPQAEDDKDCLKSHYLPHHDVAKENSVSTKLQVVLDGSCVTMTGASLNGFPPDAPNIDADLFEVLLRFRSYLVVFTLDVKKLYRRLLLYSGDVNYRRTSTKKDIQHIRLLTATYGLKSSGFSVIAAFHKAAEVFDQQCREAAEPIKHTNVNDSTSGADSVKKTIRLKQINEILGQAGFTRRKWSSNLAQLLGSLTDISAAMPIQFPGERNTVKALETHWLPAEDVYTFKVTMPTEGPKAKQQLLSDSAKLFDPFGWFAAVVVRVKIINQKCWLYELNWYDPLHPVIQETWVDVLNLYQLERIKTQRQTANCQGRSQLLSFSDASEEAHAALVYPRSEGDVDGVHVGLIVAKTTVVPVIQIFIPRLKLNAVGLLAKPLQQEADSFKRFQIEQYAWTGETSFLQWLYKQPHKWEIYKANRTSSIQKPRTHWVAPDKNRAACAFHGSSHQELVDHPLWLAGPAWLTYDSASWRQDVPDDAHNGAALERYTSEKHWHLWHHKLVAKLHPRGRISSSQQNTKHGQLVIITCNSPPSAWELSRTVAVHPDQRGYEPSLHAELLRSFSVRAGSYVHFLIEVLPQGGENV